MQTVRLRRQAGLPAPPLSRHLVFAGNPGTGKTTVARLYGRLLKALGMLERGHLVEVVVIAAGYPGDMERFISSNPGLSSRFTRSLLFADYNSEEPVRIVEHHAQRHRYELSEGARAALGRHFDAIPRDARFGNGRTARQVFQAMTERQALRITELTAPVEAQLVVLDEQDTPEPAPSA
ncbi:hypothetical protein ACFY0N_11055 [Streptomyces vinaceus]|uniref:hypothetical protein n=1 Tax=Streptomyces vinaceus TaxID=1960 RepID=UPI0036BEF4AA